jgi:hypothetical protein
VSAQIGTDIWGRHKRKKRFGVSASGNPWGTNDKSGRCVPLLISPMRPKEPVAPQAAKAEPIRGYTSIQRTR